MIFGLMLREDVYLLFWINITKLRPLVFESDYQNDVYFDIMLCYFRATYLTFSWNGFDNYFNIRKEEHRTMLPIFPEL